MPDGRVRCELCEGFRAVRELQQDEPRRAGASEHVIYFPPARAAGSRLVSVLRFRPAVRSVGASPSDPLQLGQTDACLLPSPHFIKEPLLCDPSIDEPRTDSAHQKEQHLPSTEGSFLPSPTLLSLPAAKPARGHPSQHRPCATRSARDNGCTRLRSRGGADKTRIHFAFGD